jgi:hypothetical protein
MDVKKDSEEMVTVSLRMPRSFSLLLDMQASANGRTKTDLLLGGANLLLSTPLLLRNTHLYNRDAMRNTCRLLQATLTQEAFNAPETMQTDEADPAYRVARQGVRRDSSDDRSLI